MNHLKKYRELVCESKSYEVSKIDELSEYLQEFFDKWGIKQGDNKRHGKIDSTHGLCWYTTNYKIGQSLYIVNVPSKIFDSLVSDLHMARPQVETRINSVLNIGTPKNANYPYIMITLR